jgi:hypothetical protein
MYPPPSYDYLPELYQYPREGERLLRDKPLSVVHEMALEAHLSNKCALLLGYFTLRELVN